jgi:hypothetical protein
MNEKNVIEICLGVGTNQIFPEIITLEINEEENFKPNIETERDHENYYYFNY